MAAATETVRREWEEGHRRFDALVRDPVLGPNLLAQLEAVTDELRKRIGQTFTLDELAAAYKEAERWSRDVISERAPSQGWARTVAVVEDEAFHQYQRGAVDYVP
jgi:cobyrinic acid a,c-diamide synthase